jgi:hypothetical protein
VGELLQESDEHAATIDTFGWDILPMDTHGWSQAEIDATTELSFPIVASAPRVSPEQARVASTGPRGRDAGA